MTTQKNLEFYKAKIERQHHKIDKLKAQIDGQQKVSDGITAQVEDERKINKVEEEKYRRLA